ncbi:MAG TPA: DUF6526 family protein [Holophagaceae bacterium]|jgi:hypothetical protein|nr:DUF6526 family protein [Holophagaceae bacterium]
MTATEPQSYKNHRRFDLSYHVVLALILAVNLVYTIVLVVHDHGFAGIWRLVMALAFLLIFLKLRTYPLKAQDRIIRLEERLRLEALLPADLKARIGELRPSQLVGLRFASDGEIADRVREALDEKLGNEQIKKRVQTWRADEFRV